MFHPDSIDQFSEKALRGLRYTEFVVSMLDDRHNIEQQLRLKPTALYATYRGYREDQYIAPDILYGLTDPEITSSTIDISVEKTDDVRITGVTIDSDNRPPVFIHPEPDSIHDIAEVGDIVRKLPPKSTEAVARSFLPAYIPDDIETDQVIKALSILSPEKDEVIEYIGSGTNFTSIVRFTSIETFNDSIETLEVTKLQDHPSGAIIGTRLRITESLQQRFLESNQRVQLVDQSLEVQTQNETVPIITIEDIFNDTGKVVRVLIPTKKHIASVNDALDVLRRARL